MFVTENQTHKNNEHIQQKFFTSVNIHVFEREGC